MHHHCLTRSLMPLNEVVESSHIKTPFAACWLACEMLPHAGRFRQAAVQASTNVNVFAATSRQADDWLIILIQAIKKHIPAIGSLLIVVKGRFPDAIPMPERPVIRLEQLDWLTPIFGILRGMICIRPPQAIRIRVGVIVRAALIMVTNKPYSCFVDWTKPSTPSLVLGTLTDLTRSKSELVAENALLR